MWYSIVKKDIKCSVKDTLSQCLRKAVTFSVLEIPIVDDNNVLRGVLNLNKIAYQVGELIGKFDKIKCIDVSSSPRLTIAIEEDPPLLSVLKRMVENNTTVAYVVNKPNNTYEGLILLRDLLKVIINNKLGSLRISGDFIVKRAALLGDDENLIQAIEILAHRNEPCGIVYDGYEVSSIMCLGEALSVSTSINVNNVEYYVVDQASRKPVFIDINDTLEKAIEMLNEYQVDMLIVSDEYGNILGVLTVNKLASKILEILEAKGEG